MNDFIFDPGIKFECTMCGSCCSNIWDIQVDEDTVSQIEKLNLSEINPSLADSPAFYSTQMPDGETLHYLRHIDNKCCFLNKNNLCDIQARAGYELKPRICKMFPFKLVQMEEKFYVSASFVCPSILYQTGKPVQSHMDELIRIRELNKDRVTPISEISLSETIKITPGAYLEIEKMLLTILQTESKAFPVRLIACSVALDMLNTLIQVSTIRTSNTIDECIDGYIKKVYATNFERIFKLADKNISSSLLQRILLGMILGFRTTFTKKRGHLKTFMLLIYNHVAHSLRIGNIQLSPNDKKISYSKISRVRIPKDDPEINRILLRFYTHLLIRKDLLLHKDILLGFKTFLIFHALINLYARGLCVLKGIDTVTANEVLEAVSYVEKYFIFHSDFFQIMQKYPIVSDTLSNFIHKKRFPYIMVNN